MNANRTRRADESQSPVALLEVGEHIPIAGIGEATVESLRQRNWSRVATATCDGERYFLKQFVDRVGRWHRRGLRGDQETLSLLGDTVADVQVLPTIDVDDRRLITVSPYIEMTTIDSIARRDSGHDEMAARVGEALARVLIERAVPNDDECVAVWKGLDPKNVGWSSDGNLWVFDFGPPVEMTRHDAAALVVAAGLLSRWVARPGLHLIAPESSILRGVTEPVASMTTLGEVQAALRRHQELRRREPQREGLLATATQVGLQTLGRVHWRSVNREAERLFS